MNFWDTVENLRKKQNTSYRWLAEKMNVSETTVSSMRHAQTEPRATEAVKIAQALGTTVEYLVTGFSPVTPRIPKDVLTAINALKDISDRYN